jgi:hypothetical protein
MIAAFGDVGWSFHPALRSHIGVVQEEAEVKAVLLWEWLNQMVSAGVLEGWMSSVWEQAAALGNSRMRELRSMTLWLLFGEMVLLRVHKVVWRSEEFLAAINVMLLCEQV